MSGKQARRIRKAKQQIDRYILEKERDMLLALMARTHNDDPTDYAAMEARVATMNRIMQIEEELKHA